MFREAPPDGTRAYLGSLAGGAIESGLRLPLAPSFDTGRRGGLPVDLGGWRGLCRSRLLPLHRSLILVIPAGGQQWVTLTPELQSLCLDASRYDIYSQNKPSYAQPVSPSQSQFGYAKRASVPAIRSPCSWCNATTTPSPTPLRVLSTCTVCSRSSLSRFGAHLGDVTPNAVRTMKRGGGGLYDGNGLPLFRAHLLQRRVRAELGDVQPYQGLLLEEVLVLLPVPEANLVLGGGGVVRHHLSLVPLGHSCPEYLHLRTARPSQFLLPMPFMYKHSEILAMTKSCPGLATMLGQG